MTLAVAILSWSAASTSLAKDVVIRTSLGDIPIELLEEEAPLTVENFLNYVNSGEYVNSFIHRSIPGFVIQGGGYRYEDDVAVSIPTNPPVQNEPGISNVRGTLAMAKLADDENSATSQWFINVNDNTALDESNGGFTVFGRVTDEGMAVADAIADLEVWNAGSPFNSLPLIDYTTGSVARENLVFAEAEAPSRFQINQGISDAWFNPETNGQGFFIIVYPDINLIFMSWFTFDTDTPSGVQGTGLGHPQQRWFTAFGNYADNQAVLEITMTEGGVFDNGDPAPVDRADGTIILEFEGCENGTVSYDIPSVNLQGAVPIERIAGGNLALCQRQAGITEPQAAQSQGQSVQSTLQAATPAIDLDPTPFKPRVQGVDEFRINQGLNDAWFNPETNGQGFFIITYPDIELMFLSWFTFDTELPGTDATSSLGHPGHRWMTAFGNYTGTEADLDIVITENGVFDQGIPAPVDRSDGTMKVNFMNCGTGTVAYDVPSIQRQGVVPIQRIAGGNVPLCEVNAEFPELQDAPAQAYPVNVQIQTLIMDNIGGGKLTHCRAESLPAGLIVVVSDDLSTCELRGTPSAEQSATDHEIVAINAAGESTSIISITIEP